MLKFSLRENKLTERPDDYWAQPHSAGSIDEAALVDLVMRHNSTLTRGDILAVFDIVKKEIDTAIRNGYTLNLPLIGTNFSISGVFRGPKDSFDRSRHRIKLNITKGTILREAERNLTKAERTNPTQSLAIQEFRDIDGMLQVRGFNIKIDGENPTCGLWLVGEDGMETRVTSILENMPSRIIARIPDLAPGEYQVKVVTQYAGTVTLKTPREFVFQKNLIVSKKESM